MMSRAEAQQRGAPVVPEALESPRGKLIYLYLDARGEAHLEQLTADLGLSLMTVCPLLETLEGQGLIHRDGDRLRSSPHSEVDP